MEYCINAFDVIESISEDWVRFYTEESQSESPVFVGTSIWDSIGGEDTISLYRDLFHSVRHSQEKTTFAFRCDSPEAKRHFEMTVTPLNEGRLRIQTQLVDQTELNPAVYFKTSVTTAPNITTRCSICNNIKKGKDWLDVSQAFEKGLMDHNARTVTVAYSVCEDCHASIQAKRAKLA